MILSCDNHIVMPDLTADERIYLVKNSDRPEYETQPVRYEPRRTARDGQTIQLRYIELPEVSETYAHIGSAPYWCWGYEQGVNEHGLAIGNEATFSRCLASNIKRYQAGDNPDHGIVGMELLRIGLERAKTAREAVDIMTAIIEEYGQWGAAKIGDPHDDGSYDNTFMIVDANEAYVLETAGYRWVAQKLGKGFWAISNEQSIRDEWTEASSDLTRHAKEKGWPGTDGAKVDFARAYVDPTVPRQVSHIRVQRQKHLLKQIEPGTWTPDDGIRVMSDHYEGTFLDGPMFNAGTPDFLSICMHSSPGKFTWGNTASSSIFPTVKNEDNFAMMWWAPVTPCTSIYIPMYVDAAGLPASVSDAGGADTSGTSTRPADANDFSESSLWWWFQALLDWAKTDTDSRTYCERQQLIRRTLDPIQQRWFAEAKQVEQRAAGQRRAGDTEAMARTLREFTTQCVDAAISAAKQLISSSQ